MKKYSGIDLHSNNNVVVVIDEADRVVYRRRLPNELGKVLEALEPYRAELAGVVVESTYNWYWLVDGLQAAGYPVHLANPARMKRYEGLKHSGDDTDAVQLAHLLRLGILPTGYIYPVAERGLRDLGRRRLQLVRHRTMHVLAVENVQARQTGARMTGDRVKRLSAQEVQALGLPEDVTLGLQANVAVIGALNEEIAKLEKHLARRLRPRPEYALLDTTPGVGRILGPIIAWAFIEAANMARRWCPEARRFHDRKKARTNAIVATKALAHKLARACYHMLKTGQPFDMQRCFG
jgi:transposase